MAYSIYSTDLQQYPGNESLATLAGNINALNRTAQQMANMARIPNAPELEAQSTRNIMAELKGQVPIDVLNVLGQQAAERGVAIGSPGSANANAAYLRALGLTSLGQQQAGQQHLSAAYARNPAAPLFDITTQLITPYQQEQLRLSREQLRQQGQIAQGQLELQARNQADAAAYRNAALGASALTGRGTGGQVMPQGQMVQNPFAGPTAEGIFSYGSSAQVPENAYFTGAGTYGTVWDALRSGTYQDPTTGMTSVWDPTAGSWYNWDTGEYASLPAGTTDWGQTMSMEDWARPYSPGYQPTSAGTMYMGDFEDYYSPEDWWEWY